MFMNWAEAGSDECEVENSESHSWTDCGNQYCHLLFLGSAHPVYYRELEQWVPGKRQTTFQKAQKEWILLEENQQANSKL